MKKIISLLLLTLLLAVTACDSSGEDSIEGTYALIGFGDNPLPVFSNFNFVEGQGIVSIGCITDGLLTLKGRTYRIVFEESEYVGPNCGDSYIGEGRDLVESGSYEAGANTIVLLPTESPFDFDDRTGEIVGGLITFPEFFAFQRR